jgi:hypothetical protein
LLEHEHSNFNSEIVLLISHLSEKMEKFDEGRFHSFVPNVEIL